MNSYELALVVLLKIQSTTSSCSQYILGVHFYHYRKKYLS